MRILKISVKKSKMKFFTKKFKKIFLTCFFAKFKFCLFFFIFYFFAQNLCFSQNTPKKTDNAENDTNTELFLSLDVPSSPILFSYDGRPLRRYAAPDGVFRETVPLDRVSPWFVLAIMAAEDKRFFSHSGVDVKAIARAAAQNVKAGRTVSGASTITQQLYRAYNPVRHNIPGKIREAAAAIRMEMRHTKEEILQAYINMIPFGNNLSGVQAAALSYFGVSADELSLSQAAALAGLPQAPSLYNPISNPKGFEMRRIRVLDMMLEAGYIDSDTHRIAVSEKPEALRPAQPFLAPHFAAWVAEKAKGGGRIITSLRPDIQQAVQSAIRNNVSRLERKYHVTNGAAVVIDNRTGEILAWAGSKDFFDDKNSGQIDGVRALRQPGSALKPFLYGLAFSKGFSPYDLISDEPFHGTDGYSPLNYDKKNHGMVSLREALACSYNIPAVRLADRIGTEQFLEVLHSFGFESLHRDGNFYGSGLALGNGEVRLLELAAAYSALARGGLWQPLSFERGRKSGQQRRALDEKSTFLVTNVLSDNDARIAAFGEDSPLRLPFDFAAKTGTSKDYRDNWAAGYTPEWTVAVWVGNFDGSPMRRISGITGAAPTMRDIAMYLHSHLGSTPFTPPEGIVQTEICRKSGMPASEGCTSRITDYVNEDFLKRPACDGIHQETGNISSPDGNVYVEFPKNGDIFKIDPSYPLAAQGIRFKASRNAQKPEWKLDGKSWNGGIWQLVEGRHELYFYDGKKKSSKIVFTIVR